jgi:hypothetical protein
VNFIDEDQRIAELHREATRLSDSGDLSAAIKALMEAQEKMRHSNISYPTESWTRLPLYMQRGGLFSESMNEFNKLLDELGDRISRELSHQPKRFHAGFCCHPRAVIYDKIRLACSRQGNKEEAGKYLKLRDDERLRARESMKVFDEWMADKLAKREKRS